jgi:uncharacterized protein (DUF302 family)
MSYYFSKTVNGKFETIETSVKALLKNEGFGVLTEIDMQTTLDKIGMILPCNIILQEHSQNKIEVSAINPMESMQAVDNSELKKVAKEVSSKLENVINKLENETPNINP